MQLKTEEIISHVHAIFLSHTKDFFIGLVAHGSAIKGGFINGCSDIDFMLYLKDAALNSVNKLPLELCIGIQKDLSQIDIIPFRYIQFRVITPSTNKFLGQ